MVLLIIRRISMLPYTARFDAEGRLSSASMVWLPLRDTVLPSTSCEASAYVRTKGDLMSHGRPAILAEGLEKSYGKNRALRGLDLAAEEGSVLGLLGPNGAGKTTAVRILATLLRPDAGRAEVAGLDVVQGAERLRSRIGLTGQYAAVDEYLTGRENLEMFGRLYRLSKKQARRRADELLERFDLADAASRLVKTYSGGMRRRLDLAASLVVSPPVLFLDEPTTGLDPRSRLAVWDLIAELVAGGTTLLLTTQYLEEADRLADRITVVDRGRVIAEGTSSELKARVGGERLEVTVLHEADLDAASRALEPYSYGEGNVLVDVGRRQVSATVASGARPLAAVVRDLDAAGVELDDLGLRRPTLDDVFLALTGHAAQPNEAGQPDDRYAEEIA
jgi:ABC-2 type transport system ATP-binding protein